MIVKQMLVVVGMFITFYLFSVVLVGLVFGTPGDPPEKIKKVDPISAEFDQLDPRVFNDDSLNPTQLIEIKESNNDTVFSVGEED